MEIEWIHWITRAVEIAGIAIIAVGAFGSLMLSSLGGAILLGLEFLIAADIINTVAIEPTLQSLAALAGIVPIRTVLNCSLEVEIEGRWPWRRGEGTSAFRA